MFSSELVATCSIHSIRRLNQQLGHLDSDKYRASIGLIREYFCCFLHLLGEANSCSLISQLDVRNFFKRWTSAVCLFARGKTLWEAESEDVKKLKKEVGLFC